MVQQELNQLLWYLVHQHVKKSKANALNTADDLFAEARFAADCAIATFDINKKTKLSTYIAACVTNRFKNIAKQEGNRITLVQAEDEDGISEPFSQREFELSMKRVLDAEEFKVFIMRYYEDESVLQIASRLKMTRREVTKCLHRISQKYLLLDVNLDRTLTQRRLTENFLSSSPSSQNES